ncbi:MAG: substrate-binding domain-containing protein [Planctomycetaceae bacterium]|nr:substrate-binding domain-containing protein [Planctomycetaceae bacterium]
MRKMVLLASCLVIGLAVTAFGGEKKPLVGISIIGAEHNWDINAFTGAQDKARELGAEVLAFDGERRIEKQLSDIKTLITRKVDIIVVILGDEKSLVPALKEAREAGIPVVTADFNNPYTLCEVQTNNFAAMSDVVLKMVADLGGKGKIATFSVPGIPVSDVRENTIKLVLQSYPEIEIVAAEVAAIPGTVPDAYNKAKDLMRTHPDLKAFIAIFDMPLIGVAQAIEDEGKTGDVGCYGFDGDPTAMKMILDPASAYRCTAVQQPYAIGATAAATALDVLAGKPVPRMKFVGYGIADKENALELINTYEQYEEIRAEVN